MEVPELPRLHRSPLSPGRPEIGVALVLVVSFGAFRVDSEQELDELGERVEVEELRARVNDSITIRQGMGFRFRVVSHNNKGSWLLDQLISIPVLTVELLKLSYLFALRHTSFREPRQHGEELRGSLGVGGRLLLEHADEGGEDAVDVVGLRVAVVALVAPERLVEHVGEAGAHVLGRALQEERPQDVEAAAVRGRL